MGQFNCRETVDCFPVTDETEELRNSAVMRKKYFRDLWKNLGGLKATSCKSGCNTACTVRSRKLAKQYARTAAEMDSFTTPF